MHAEAIRRRRPHEIAPDIIGKAAPRENDEVLAADSAPGTNDRRGRSERRRHDTTEDEPRYIIDSAMREHGACFRSAQFDLRVAARVLDDLVVQITHRVREIGGYL